MSQSTRIALGLTIGITSCGRPLPGPDPHLSIDLTRHEPAPSEMSVRGIAEKCGPSVVVVEGQQKQGSGFFVSSHPWVATNAHVVEGEDKLSVVLRSGTKLDVQRVVKVDHDHDLAILELAPGNYPPVSLGDDGDAHVGDTVVAIGAPLGLEQTVSEGNVSAFRTTSGGLKLIQISVPISHGSSGGALFDHRGRLIGVTSAGIDEGQNLNFALPVGLLKDLLAGADTK